MTRTVSATITAAIGEDVTRPIYLIQMGWDVASPDVNRYVATWAADIDWNSLTWLASGVEVRSFNGTGGSLQLPNGDADPWLALVTSQDPRGRALAIYEYHTDFTASPIASDATLLFTGVMDGSEVSDDQIRIDFIESVTNKSFPLGMVDAATFSYLIKSGQRFYWGPDIVLVR